MRFMVKTVPDTHRRGVGHLFIWGVQEVRLSTVAKKTPQLISCEALGRKRSW